MNRPYTYYLYHVPTGKKYYGYRFANKCEPKEDLWSIYFSSSELVKELIKEYGKESFRAEVRKLFDTREEAHEYEQRFLHKVKAVESKEWLNRAYATGFYFYGVGEKNPMFGKVPHNKGVPHTEETKIKIGNRGRGRKHREDTKTQLSESHKGKRNSQFGADHSHHRHTETSKQTIRDFHTNSRWYHNDKEQRTRKFKPNTVPNGWMLGMKKYNKS